MLLAEHDKATVTAYLALAKLVKKDEEIISSIQAAIAIDSPRSAVLKRAVAGSESALALLKEIMSILRHRLNLDTLISHRPEIDPDKARPYLNPLSYALRDWGGLDESEEEISRVMKVMERYSAFSPRRGSVTVLGAGLGRYGCEFLGCYDTVYAIERSLPMALLFGMLRLRDIELDSVNLVNCKNIVDAVRHLTLSRRRTKNKPRIDGQEVAYAVGDAKQLPIATGSQSALASIFFTDVVPISRLVMEAGRVLEPGGLFIHFGPLNYHTEVSVSERLSAEEVRDLFKGSKFTILAEDWHPGFHLERIDGLAKMWYNNWSFVARYEGRPEQSWTRQPIDNLCIIGCFKFESTFKLIGRTKTIVRAKIITSNDRIIEINGCTAEIVLDLMADKPFSIAISKANEKYGHDIRLIQSVYRDIEHLTATGILGNKRS